MTQPDHATFRANPAFELVVLDRLTAEQRAVLGDAQDDPDLYGVLLPHDPGPTAKAVDRDTALLYLTLRQPGPLPGYMQSLGSELEATVRRLVLDGVLEIAHDGGFVSGPDALAALGEDEAPAAGGRIARLSLEALRYAARQRITDLPVLAGRIYAYNRLPLSARWARRFPDRASVARLADGSQIGSRWTQTAGTDDADIWRAWARATGHSSNGGTTHKLYVSPQPAALADALRITVEVLGQTEASGFKVGSDLVGILRPDKFVVYFSGLDPLAEAAEKLRPRLEGLPAHGVPFTAEIAGDGLLSWGVDPPRTEHTSWRVWLAHRLAGALLAAREESEPWRYALERIRLEGVDPQTWAPSQAMWR
jgi:hypothetical protein